MGNKTYYRITARNYVCLLRVVWLLGRRNIEPVEFDSCFILVDRPITVDKMPFAEFGCEIEKVTYA